MSSCSRCAAAREPVSHVLRVSELNVQPFAAGHDAHVAVVEYPWVWHLADTSEQQHAPADWRCQRRPVQYDCAHRSNL